MLHSTSALARPKSASSKTTSLFDSANLMARFTAMLLLPTPPLPLVMAITLARGRARTIDRNDSAWSNSAVMDSYLPWLAPYRQESFGRVFARGLPRYRWEHPGRLSDMTI